MNNETNLTLFDSELPQEQDEQELFDYEKVPEDKRPFVLQKTAEIQWLLKRTSEDIIKIGQYLIAVKDKLPHGMFGKWLKCEFGMSNTNASHFMNIAKRLESKFSRRENLDLGMEVLRELASPSTPDAYIDQVVAGLTPTLEDIKKARQEARLAKQAEAKAKADAEAMQRELFDLQENSQNEIKDLTEQHNAGVQKLIELYSAQMKELKQELEENSTPKIEIREVPRPVLPESVKNTLVGLQNQIDELTTSVEAEKKTVPPETQKQLGELQKQLETLKETNRLQEQANKTSKERIQHLDSQLKVAIKDRITSEDDERIRQEWRSINSEARSCLMRLLGSWPTSLDINSFESDDWERLSQLKTTLKRVLEECDNLNYSGDDMVNVDEAPIAYIEAGR